MNKLEKSGTISYNVKLDGKPPPFVTHSAKTKINSISSHNGDKRFNSSVSPTFIQRKAIDLSINSTSTNSVQFSDTISLDNESIDAPPNIPPPPPPLQQPLVKSDSIPLLESIPPPVPDSSSSSEEEEEEKENEEEEEEEEEDKEEEEEEEEEEDNSDEKSEDKFDEIERNKSIKRLSNVNKISPLKRVKSRHMPIQIIPQIDDSEFLSDLQKYNRIISGFTQQLENLNNEFEVNKLTVIKNIENHHTELYKKYKEDVDTKIKNVEKDITTDLEERRRNATNARTDIKKNMDIRNEKKEGSTVDIWILRIFRLYHSFIVYTASFIYILPLLKIRKYCSKNKEKSHK